MLQALATAPNWAIWTLVVLDLLGLALYLYLEVRSWFVSPVS